MIGAKREHRSSLPGALFFVATDKSTRIIVPIKQKLHDTSEKRRAELLTVRIMIAPQHGSIQALTKFYFRLRANRR